MSDEYIIYDPAEFDKIEIKPVENSDEITRLRADLAAVTAERDRMKEAIKLISGQPLSSELDAEAQDNADYEGAYDSCIKAARAAIEGVTEPAPLKAETEFFVFDEFAILPEPASPWRDIESAPKDGTSIEVWDESQGAVNPAVVFWENGVWVYADNLLADAAPDGALPSHWRQRSEPPR